MRSRSPDDGRHSAIRALWLDARRAQACPPREVEAKVFETLAGLVLGPSPNSLQNEADLPLGCRMVVTSRESEIMERSIGWTLPAKIGAPRFPQKSTGAWEV